MKTYDSDKHDWGYTKEARHPPRMMPLMYSVYDEDPKTFRSTYVKTLVIIAVWDQKHYRHDWWDWEELKDKQVLQPDVDVAVEVHEFTGENGELEAIKFMRQWWVDHPIKEEEMKLLEAEYVGLEKPFTKIRVKIKSGSREREGVFLFENDGRDFEVEGDLDRQEICDNMEDLIFGDEPMKLLGPELAKGTKEYEGEE